MSPNGCRSTQIPVCGTLNSNNDIVSIARHGDTLYYMNVFGSLYRTTLGSSQCDLLGVFIYGGNALTVADDGIVYAAGSSLSSYNPYTKAFRQIGYLPANMGSSGDLAFYKGKLYLAGGQNKVIQVDILNPSQSIIWMSLSNSNVFGLASVATDCKTSKIFALGSHNGLPYGSTDIVELDIDNQKEVGITCTLPFTVYDAASLTEDGSFLNVKVTSILRKNICSNVGGDGQITFEASGSNANKYTFTLGNGTTNATGIFSGLVTGTYNVHIVSQEGCEKDTLATLVSVNPPLINNITVDPFCNGYNEKITVFASSPGTSNLWYSVNAGTFQTRNVFTGLPIAAYNVSVRDTDYCVSTGVAAKPSFSIRNPYQSIDITPELCANKEGMVTIHPDNNIPSPVFSINSGTIANSPTFSNLKAGSYLLSIFSDNNACRFDSTIVLKDSLTVKPDIDIIAKAPLCFDRTGSVEVSISNATNSPYIFSINGNIANTQNVITGVASGDYTIHTIDVQGCSWEDDVQVLPYVKNNLTSKNFTTVSPTCNYPFAGSITVDTKGLDAPYTSVLNNVNYYDANIIGNLTKGDYKFLIYDKNNCLTDSVSKTFNLIADRSPLSSIQLSADLCKTASGSAFVNVVNSANAYLFSVSGGAFTPNNNFQNLRSGFYALSVEGNDCRFDTTFTIKDSLTDKPTVTLVGTSPTCYDVDNGKMNLQINGTSSTYTVGFVGTTISLQGSNRNKLYQGLPSGRYALTIQDKEGCNWDTSAIVAPFMLQKPIISLTQENSTCFQPKKGRIDIDVIGVDNPYTIFLNTSNYPVPQHFSGLSAGAYVITVADKNNCVVDSTLFELLLVSDGTCDTLFVPSAFTPNGDGINETLKPLGGTGVSEIYFSVYNRFGQPVFNSKDISVGWTGYLNGILQPTGTYVWLLQYKTSAGILKMQKGTTVLIR
ncbi:gliding motility-associated C-terminal domain-containing protein [Chitinophagaceae bacterium LWZ2-11]